MKVFCDLDLHLNMYSVPESFRKILESAHQEVEIIYGTDINTIAGNVIDVYWGNRPPSDLAEIQRKIQWIHLGCVGIDRIKKIKNLPSNVVVTNSPGSATIGVANHTLYQILDIYRGGGTLHSMNPLMEVNYGRESYDKCSPDIVNNKKVLIVGYGDIGKEVKKYLEVFNCKVAGIASRRRTEDIEIYGMESLITLAEQSDIIIGLLPVKEELNNIFDVNFFNSCSDAVFINNGRSAHVDEGALYDALRKKNIRGAALDNYKPNGLIAKNEKGYNLLLSPHIAVYNPHYWKQQVDLFNSNLQLFRSGDLSKMRGMIQLS